MKPVTGAILVLQKNSQLSPTRVPTWSYPSDPKLEGKVKLKPKSILNGIRLMMILELSTTGSWLMVKKLAELEKIHSIIMSVILLLQVLILFRLRL